MAFFHDRTITSRDVDEVELHHFVTEASDIGIRPGAWPDIIPTTLGNSHGFCFEDFDWIDGEVAAANYKQANGCISLYVLND